MVSVQGQSRPTLELLADLTGPISNAIEYEKSVRIEFSRTRNQVRFTLSLTLPETIAVMHLVLQRECGHPALNTLALARTKLNGRRYIER